MKKIPREANGKLAGIFEELRYLRRGMEASEIILGIFKREYLTLKQNIRKKSKREGYRNILDLSVPTGKSTTCI